METLVPFAKQYEKQMKRAWAFSKGHPQGLIVHFNAGRDGTGTLDYGIKQGYNYFILLRDGTLYQACPLSHGGHHAGTSAWEGLGSGVSSKCIGVEISSAGRLTKTTDGKFMTWFNTEVPASEVRYVDKKPLQQAGYYQIYTKAQEETLIKLCLWLKHNAPEIFNLDYVLGHDEVATPNGRKNDPGGALSMSMPEFRKLLKDKWNSEVPIDTVPPVEVKPEKWNPLIFLNKMDNYFSEPTQARYDDLKEIVWPSAKKKILDLTTVDRNIN